MPPTRPASAEVRFLTAYWLTPRLFLSTSWPRHPQLPTEVLQLLLADRAHDTARSEGQKGQKGALTPAPFLPQPKITLPHAPTLCPADARPLQPYSSPHRLCALLAAQTWMEKCIARHPPTVRSNSSEKLLTRNNFVFAGYLS